MLGSRLHGRGVVPDDEPTQCLFLFLSGAWAFFAAGWMWPPSQWTFHKRFRRLQLDMHYAQYRPSAFAALTLQRFESETLTITILRTPWV
jgi:hypothetical protein